MFRSYHPFYINTELPKPSPKCCLTCRVAIVRDPVTLAAEDPQEYEERTVMILEPSKKWVAHFSPAPVGCVEASTRSTFTRTQQTRKELGGGNLSNSDKSKFKMNQQQQWMRSNKSELGQRCQDFTWRRRLDTRRSAARRPFTFQFQTRVAIIITKDIVYRSSRYEVLRVVNSIKTKM